MGIKTWDEMKIKYPENREEMSEEREREFVEDCFVCYENEGFAKKFWSPYGSEDKKGQSFKVIGRCTVEDEDLSNLPMWKIEFEDGTVLVVFPEEIIAREMRANGCCLDGIE